MVFSPRVLQFSHSSPGISGIGSLLPFWRSDPNNFFFFPPHQSIFQSSACSLSLPPFRPLISSPFSVTLLFHFSFTSHNIHYITPIIHHCHANNLPSTEQAAKTKPKQDKSFSFIFPCFWLVICCLSVILWPDNGDFAENLYNVCPC